MPEIRTGFVVGKFYPYHKGHAHLIKTARDMTSGEVIVAVCRHPKYDRIPAELRAEWIQDAHPGVRVLITDDDIGDEGEEEVISALWAAKTRKLAGYTPDAVFTSEHYGERWAKALGCQHVMVDLHRSLNPVSGSGIIQHGPIPRWQWIPSAVQKHLCKRVVLIGAESTGKTTLARTITNKWRLPFVEEYGRTITEQIFNSTGKMPDWDSHLFVHIAWMQRIKEDAAVQHTDGLLVSDTDALSTALWHERYMGYPSGKLERMYRDTQPTAYILTDINTPFAQDEIGSREDGEHREWMHEEFKVRAKEMGTRVFEVSGTPEERFDQADRILTKIVQEPMWND